MDSVYWCGILYLNQSICLIFGSEEFLSNMNLVTRSLSTSLSLNFFLQSMHWVICQSLGWNWQQQIWIIGLNFNLMRPKLRSNNGEHDHSQWIRSDHWAFLTNKAKEWWRLRYDEYIPIITPTTSASWVYHILTDVCHRTVSLSICVTEPQLIYSQLFRIYLIG